MLVWILGAAPGLASAWAPEGCTPESTAQADQESSLAERLDEVLAALDDTGDAQALVDGLRELIAIGAEERSPRLVEALARTAARADAAAREAYGRGEVGDAHELFELVLGARELALDPDADDLQRARMNLAVTASALGRRERALELQTLALDVWSRTRDDHDHELLTLRMNRAGVAVDLGRIFDGLADLEAVWRIRSATAEPEDRSRLLVSVNLARARLLVGDAVGGHELAEEAHAVLARTRPELDPLLRFARTVLAQAKQDLGDLDGAQALSESALDALERSYPPDHPDTQYQRQNLAVIAHERGDFERALDLLKSAHAVLSKTLPEDDPELLLVENSMGLALLELGDAEGALARFEGAASRASSLPPSHPTVRSLRANLALAHFHTGDSELALDLFDACVASAPVVEAPEHVTMLLDHAATLALTGDLAKARSRALEAADVARRLLSRWSTRLSLRAVLAANRRHARVLSLVLSYRPADADVGSAAREELEVVHAFRGLVDRRARDIERLHRSAAGDAELTRALSETAALGKALVQAHQAGAADERIARLREDLELAQARLATRSVGRDRRPPELLDLLDDVPTDEAILVTTGYDRVESGEVEPVRMQALFLATRGSVRRFDLGPEARIVEHAAAFRSELEGRLAGVRGPPDVSFGSSRQDSGRGLAECLAPVFEALPEGVRSLSIAADGPFASVPWGALPGTDGRWLDERFAIAYVESLWALAPRPSVEASPSLLVVGGVDYGPEPASPEGRAVEAGSLHPFAGLPGSARESQAIAASFRDVHPKAQLTRLTGRDASRGAFLARASSSRYLHLATHAFSQPAEGAGGSVSAAGDLQAGIAFAGATAASTSDPAVVSAFELAQLDLSACELAVLSGCRTNVGPRDYGGAAAGLNRALCLAGARATISSLWRVSDEGAVVFFEAFYDRLWAGSSVREAFGAARRATREAGFGPGVWAAFVLYRSGD